MRLGKRERKEKEEKGNERFSCLYLPAHAYVSKWGRSVVLNACLAVYFNCSCEMGHEIGNASWLVGLFCGYERKGCLLECIEQ